MNKELWYKYTYNRNKWTPLYSHSEK